MKNQDQTFYVEREPQELGRDPRLNLSLKILRQMQDSLANVIQLLEAGSHEEAQKLAGELIMQKHGLDAEFAQSTGMRVIEGVFDGCNMVGSDGNSYNVPPNYASKSRLVEGDMLKLTIKPDGGFLFKQIAPIERQRITATLAEDVATGDYIGVHEDGRRWRLIRASITYYHGVPGDEVVLLVPKGSPSTWAAVENVVKH